MAENSKIEWTDHTFNPWEGCQKVGPGCDHCYAEARNARYAGGVAVNWGPGASRRRTSAANWRKPLAWSRDAGEFYAQHQRRQRVFCSSLADVFDNQVDDEWRRDLAALILMTPALDWLLLTKRIGNAVRMLSDMFPAGVPEHVWVGATIVNQEEADRDIPKLLATPAHVRFLSMEPLLGPVDVEDFLHLEHPHCTGFVPSPRYETGYCDRCAGHESDPIHTNPQGKVDWVIVGGESGPRARPMHPDWVRGLRDQCANARTPFLFKQWGEWTPGENVERHTGIVKEAYWLGEEWVFGECDLADDDGHIDDQPDLYRIGKKAAGRLLDGREWNGAP